MHKYVVDYLFCLEAIALTLTLAYGGVGFEMS